MRVRVHRKSSAPEHVEQRELLSAMVSRLDELRELLPETSSKSRAAASAGAGRAASHSASGAGDAEPLPHDEPHGEARPTTQRPTAPSPNAYAD